jgi:fibrillarin-like pre-rRNA processing protein
MVKIKKWKFSGVYYDGERVFTKNLAPTHSVYSEELVLFEGNEYRVWNPKRSKACAMLKKGGRHFPISEDSNVLYLGAASGTTASHLSDVAESGMIFCIEFSKRAYFDLVDVCETRRNMIPVLADATKPEMYRSIVGKVDLVYQDVSQRDQVGIFLLNLRNFLKPKGHGILMVKARSVDVTAKPRDIFLKAERELKKAGWEVLESLVLKPYEKDHAAIVVKKIIS